MGEWSKPVNQKGTASIGSAMMVENKHPIYIRTGFIVELLHLISLGPTAISDYAECSILRLRLASPV